MYAKAQPRTQKNAGSTWHSLPASLVAPLRREAVRRSPLIVRLGTDSVNPFRQQIYKSLVNRCAKVTNSKAAGHTKTGGSAFSPYDAGLLQALSGGVEP